MFEDYSIAKFIFSFFIVVLLIYSFYFFIVKYGQKFSINPKGEIKIKDIKFFSKDKGFILAQLKDEEFFFSFDNQNGLKLIKTYKKEDSNNENKSS